MSSIFSKIISGEIPCYKVYEDEKNLAFLDIHPEARGHVLVVPKVEVDKVYDLSEEDYIALFQAVKKVARRLDEVFGKRVILKVIGVDVPHAHVHLLPIDENFKQVEILELSEEEFEEIRKKIVF